MVSTIVLNNRYRLEQNLGTGGMAVVYRAMDLTLERSVAIKILREDFSSNSDFKERFRQEAKAAANLSHPNIVTVHDFGLDAGRLFIVMEYVPGTDLKTLMQRQSRFSTTEALPLMIQACQGLGYAHRAGLVHCDVKPQNLLVTPDKRLKIVDFGISRALASIAPEEKSDVVWGSPQYFSPEQAAGAAPSPASDVYSLGAVFYEMLTGRPPFIAHSATGLAMMHREAAPPPLRQINPDVPPLLEQVVLKVLSKEPSARYRTADQLGRVLESVSVTLSGAQTFPAGGQPAQAASATSRGRTGPVQVSRVTAPESLPPLQRPGTSRSQQFQVRQPLQPSKPEPEPEEPPLNIDFSTWALGLLALIAVGGLVPLWLWIYFLYNPPLH